MAQCTVAGLWDQVRSSPYLSRQQWQAYNLWILCQIIVAMGANPNMSTCTVSGLWDVVRGSPPFLSDQQFYAENINLLCQLLGLIIAGGGTGGGAGLDIQDAPVDRPNFPNNEPAPSNTAINWLRIYRDGTPMITWDSAALPSPRWLD